MTRELPLTSCLTVRSIDLAQFVRTTFNLPFVYGPSSDVSGTFESFDLRSFASLTDDELRELESRWSSAFERWSNDVERWRSSGRHGWLPFTSLVDGRAFPFQPGLELLMFGLWSIDAVPAEIIIILS